MLYLSETSDRHEIPPPLTTNGCASSGGASVGADELTLVCSLEELRAAVHDYEMAEKSNPMTVGSMIELGMHLLSGALLKLPALNRREVLGKVVPRLVELAFDETA